MTTKLKAKFETITPKLAAQLLKKNNINRKIRERKVNRLVETIRSGQWKVNGESICIAEDGTLLNGQHRLTAVMVSKTPIVTLVARGLSKDVMPTIDIGNPRTAADHLRMAGFKGNHGALAAAVKICLSFDQKGQYGDKKIGMSPQEMFTYLKAERGLLKSQELFEGNANLMAILPPSATIATHFLFSQIDRDAANTFFHHLETGENLGKTSPILKLRMELTTLRNDSKRGEIRRRMFLHFLCTAFDAYLNDKRVERLPEYRGDVKVTMPKVRK